MVVPLSRQEILEKLRIIGISYKNDTIFRTQVIQPENWQDIPVDQWEKREVPNYGQYTVKSLVIEKDTLEDIQFHLREDQKGKTRIDLVGLRIEKGLTEEEADKKMIKYYRKLLKRYFRKLN